LNRLYVTLPEADMEALVNEAESFTLLPSPKVHGAAGDVGQATPFTRIVVEIVGVKKTAPAWIERA
jgi:hypothetical protein